MKYQPQTWHYGIIAQHWAAFENHSLDALDVTYYRKQIERYGGPALDLACGTGRLLIPYLQNVYGQKTPSAAHFTRVQSSVTDRIVVFRN